MAGNYSAAHEENFEDSPWGQLHSHAARGQRGILFSFPANEVISSHANTRLWRRFPVDLPVRILPCSRFPAVARTGRGTELSRNGMALYAGVDIELPARLLFSVLQTSYPHRALALA
jgi:hypothetical protein